MDIASIDREEKVIGSSKRIRGIDAPSRARKVIREGDVIVSTVRPNLNAVAQVPPDLDGEICSTGFCVLRPTEEVLSEFLYFFVRSPNFLTEVAMDLTGAMYPATSDGKIRSVRLPIPSLEDQHRIVDILKRADGICRLRRQAEYTARHLIPALFIDMFGDPLRNPDQWPTLLLKEVAEIGSGVTKGRELSGAETVDLPYLRVANVQDGHLDLTAMKTITIKKTEIEKYTVSPGDFLMTERGDPDKLGRGAIWTGEVEPCLHQNHVFKVRCDQSKVIPEYLRSLVGSAYAKEYFLRVAKQTTGIASINKTQLGNFPALVPPLRNQLEFKERLNGLHAIAEQQKKGADTADRLFDSLLRGTFTGQRFTI
ncbi:MAG: restriction endonuclease subunit S [Pseudomonadota bacterium]|nr:restriction endonuclease subunit S [Pseudomonadota bacterium]